MQEIIEAALLFLLVLSLGFLELGRRKVERFSTDPFLSHRFGQVQSLRQILVLTLSIGLVAIGATMLSFAQIHSKEQRLQVQIDAAQRQLAEIGAHTGVADGAGSASVPAGQIQLRLSDTLL